MAQERIKWTLLPEGMLSIGFGNEMFDTYDLKKIFPDLESLTEVQLGIVIYGFKQNLSDKIAGMKDYTLKEKVKTMTDRYNDLVKGIWKTPAKEKTSVKKEAKKLVEDGVNDIEMAILKRLGLV